jgi:O-antigen/teichoic acid export membrane protein
MEANGGKKRLVKNTIFLYLRMAALLLINLFTTKVILNALGASDYGLYNVVGGFVLMLTFLNGAMSNASQRFITYELGRGLQTEIIRVFSQTKVLHIIIATFLFVIAETIGLWFLNTCLNIPEGKTFAANCVYQFSVLSSVLTIISVPYNSLIIAHEDLKMYAYVGLYEGIMKLVICYALYTVHSNRLILYAFLLALTSMSVRAIYRAYCLKKYPESKAPLRIDKKKLFEIGSFGGWALCGSISTLALNQGVNILVNVFFSTVVNAARGISYQIGSAINLFVVNFQTAINPRIVKAYSQGNLPEMHSLLYLSSKMSFFIMYVIVVPVTLNIKYILELWLTEVPVYTIEFSRLVLMQSLFNTFSSVLSISALASGRIRNYQLFMGGFLLLNFPLSYWAYKLGAPPYSAVLIGLLIDLFLLFMRLLFLRRMINLKVLEYIRVVLLPSILYFIISLPICVYLNRSLMYNSLFELILVAILQIIVCSVIMFFIGLTKLEKNEVVIGFKRFLGSA